MFLTDGLFIAGALLSLLMLAKDWRSHQTTLRRVVVLVLIVAVAAVGMINAHRTKNESDARHAADAIQIAELKKGIDTANRDQENNTKAFLEKFGEMSDKLSALQTQLKTAGLQEEADRLKAELEATRKALKPPQATLQFSFVNETSPNIFKPIRQVTLPEKNGVVHVEFTLLNATEVNALDVEVTLAICEKCKFVSEPAGFARLPKIPATERNGSFAHVYAHTWLSPIRADVKIPESAPFVQFGVIYRCRTCIIPDLRANTGTILIHR